MSSNQYAGSSFGLGSGGDASIFANQIPDILGIVRERLQQAASNPDLFVQVFGNKAHTSELQTVRSQWSVGDFSQLPSVQILSSANTNGAFGAYASSNQTIYLSDALFQSSAAPINSVLGAAGVLVEETFHWLDDCVGTDTLGDEGELAKDLIFGVSLSASELTRIRAEDDRGFINVNGHLTAVEMAADYAGNTRATARAVGTFTATQTQSLSFSDWVGSTDTNDYYSFNVGTQSNFSLSLTGLSANADVQLLNSSGGLITTSANTGNTSESITRQLSAGTYYARVYQSSGNTNYSLSLNATAVAPTPTPTPTPADWYSQNLRDAQIITLTRSLAADGNLSRNDIIAIFRNAEDSGVIDANELTDLRTLVSNSARFTMADSVRVLSNKIANSDPANARSGFGNLFAGSSSTQMENLIGKWFLGTDRPVTGGYSYQYVSGSLFQNGVSANDIYQGVVGDCYYVATLASIAQKNPQYVLQNMFTDNGDNTFTVRFYNNGVADYVTVDRYLPTSGNYAAYAGWGGGSVTSTSNELWVALAEKAYAQLAESGWSRTYSGTQNNSYAAIEGGWMDTVIRQVTGLSATSQSIGNMTQTQLINLVNSNQVLTAGFVYGAGYGVVNGHAYTITSYNPTNGTFHLRNPWGSSHADVTWAQLLSLSAIVQWSNT